MTKRNHRSANSTRLATYFLKRLDEGAILDRTRKVDRNHRPVIEAPKALKKI